MSIQIDESFCLGCGVCAAFCQQAAIIIRERAKRVIPPSNMSVLMQRLQQDRGR